MSIYSKLRDFFGSMWIKKKILLIVSIFSVAVIGPYSYYNYIQIKDTLYKTNCEKLLSGVYAVDFALGNSFHDKITGVESVSPEEHMQNIKKLNVLTENLNYAYAYTMVLQNDSVYFSSSSATKEEIEKGTFSPFFQNYTEVSEKVLESFKDGKVRFEEETDRWGSFQSIIFPRTSPAGKKYVIGIDIRTTDIKAQFSKILFTNLGFGFCLFAVFFTTLYFVLGRIIKPIHDLTDAAKKINKGDMSVSLTVDSKDETKILADALNMMVVSQNENMKNLSLQKKNVEEKIEQAVKESEESRKYLERSVEKILNEMNRFSEGDLTVNIIPENKDDVIGKLSVGFNHVVESLRNMVENIMQAVNSTANAGSQISSGAELMSSGISSQTMQSVDVAKSIEEMTESILNTSKNASLAADASKEAGHIAEEGGRVVLQTIEGMNKIADVVHKSTVTVQALGKSSSEIGEIVELIDDIADQTNLLALNAAIEAARAGEQGRGFAVVADEVKKLAERTSAATSNINGMIKQIQMNTVDAVNAMQEGNKQVEAGKKLADEAENSLKEIIKGANKVVDIIACVAEASEQQYLTSQQITKNIDSINMVTRQNEDSVKHISETADDLRTLTENLNNLVGGFNINHNKNIFTNN